MFDIGWSELVVIGVVALIAIGPKELPGVLRTVGQYMGKVRRMASGPRRAQRVDEGRAPVAKPIAIRRGDDGPPVGTRPGDDPRGTVELRAPGQCQEHGGKEGAAHPASLSGCPASVHAEVRTRDRPRLVAAKE